MSDNKKWTWDPEKREVVILENGEYMLGISETQYVTVRVEVKSASITVQEEGRQEAQ